MLDKGLVVTINSDDPAYFGGYVNDNYRAVSDALALRRDEIAAIVRNGFHASLMSEAEKQKALAEVERVLADSDDATPLRRLHGRAGLARGDLLADDEKLGGERRRDHGRLFAL